MIIDVIKSERHAGNGRGLGRYMLAAEQERQDQGEKLGAYITDARHQGEKLEWAATANVGTQDPRLAVEMIAAHNARNQRSKQKSMHIVASLPEGERLTSAQWRKVEAEAVKALGMERHPRLVAVHRNTQHQHMHMWISRIHPETHKAIHPPGDWYKLQRVATNSEREFGLKIEPHTLNLAQTLERRQEQKQERERLALDRVHDARHQGPEREAAPQPPQVAPIEAVSAAHDRRQAREQSKGEKPAAALRHAPGSFPASMDAAAANRALRATVEDIARELSPRYRAALEKVTELERAFRDAERALQNAGAAGAAAAQRLGERREKMGGWRRAAALDRLEPREKLEVLRWSDHKAAGLAPLEVTDVAKEISPAYRRAAAAAGDLAKELDRAEYAHKMAVRDAAVARDQTSVRRSVLGISKGRWTDRELTNAASKELGAEFNAQKRGLRVEAVREQLDTAQKRAGEEFEKVRPEAEKELSSRQSVASAARDQLATIRAAERLEQREKQQQRHGLRM